MLTNLLANTLVAFKLFLKAKLEFFLRGKYVHTVNIFESHYVVCLM